MRSRVTPPCHGVKTLSQGAKSFMDDSIVE
jgi:hypothetical protein